MKIHRLNAADLPAALKHLKVSCGQMPTEGDWAIAMPLPKRSVGIHVVDPVLLCAGKAITAFKIKDVHVAFETERYGLPKNSAVITLKAVSRRKTQVFWEDTIDVELAPGKTPTIQVFASRTRLGQTRAFFSRREAEAYAAGLIAAARGGLKKAA